eukprot:TRINITY_DN18154_c0_g2_i1.p1 TRINITY_DN18154_c0_g2~~TRINITY_DN18154_c0_g2_i1.p1  ORF type:complete len:377 (+),score=55.95 TRINITY_DN18154_c0_g2_i1:121-1251(+)
MLSWGWLRGKAPAAPPAAPPPDGGGEVRAAQGASGNARGTPRGCAAPAPQPAAAPGAPQPARGGAARPKTLEEAARLIARSQAVRAAALSVLGPCTSPRLAPGCAAAPLPPAAPRRYPTPPARSMASRSPAAADAAELVERVRASRRRLGAIGGPAGPPGPSERWRQEAVAWLLRVASGAQPDAASPAAARSAAAPPCCPSAPDTPPGSPPGAPISLAVGAGAGLLAADLAALRTLPPSTAPSTTSSLGAAGPTQPPARPGWFDCTVAVVRPGTAPAWAEVRLDGSMRGASALHSVLRHIGRRAGELLVPSGFTLHITPEGLTVAQLEWGAELALAQLAELPAEQPLIGCSALAAALRHAAEGGPAPLLLAVSRAD